jgi:hypothetical protein
MHTDRCGNTSGQECQAKGSRKETKIQEFMYEYRDTTDVEHEMYDDTGINLGHRSSNKRFKENFKAIPAKHSIDSLTKRQLSHIIRKILQSETRNLSCGDHGLFKKRKACDKKHNNNKKKNNTVIVIMLLT